ncbi:MAG TPA: winged helix-turn-helix domain-containing protein [archaeon]|nr:winged helix-turn-helix domain-containing protein [archaeon]
MDGISISTTDFKALSSKTRTDILKMLDERNFTLSELASKTGMAAPTVKQHASVLMEAGLIELNDEGRKWKYYSLTRKGKKLLEANTNKSNIFLILSTVIIVGLLGFAAMFYGNFMQSSASEALDVDRASYVVPTNQDDLAEITSGEEINAGTGNSATTGKCVSNVTRAETTEELCNALLSPEECEKFDGTLDGIKDCKWIKFDD